MSFHESKFSVNQCHKTRVVGSGNISRLEWKVKLENDTGELETPIQGPHVPFCYREQGRKLSSSSRVVNAYCTTYDLIFMFACFSMARIR